MIAKNAYIIQYVPRETLGLHPGATQRPLRADARETRSSRGVAAGAVRDPAA